MSPSSLSTDTDKLRRDLHNLRGVGFRTASLPDDVATEYSHYFVAEGCTVHIVKALAADVWTVALRFPDRPDHLLFDVPVNTLLGFPQ